jgi:hypothetical protein
LLRSFDQRSDNPDYPELNLAKSGKGMYLKGEPRDALGNMPDGSYIEGPFEVDEKNGPVNWIIPDSSPRKEPIKYLFIDDCGYASVPVHPEVNLAKSGKVICLVGKTKVDKAKSPEILAKGYSSITNIMAKRILVEENATVKGSLYRYIEETPSNPLLNSPFSSTDTNILNEADSGNEVMPNNTLVKDNATDVGDPIEFIINTPSPNNNIKDKIDCRGESVKIYIQKGAKFDRKKKLKNDEAYKIHKRIYKHLIYFIIVR